MKKHEWQPHQVFVFGSNLAGRHGAGAAKFAVDKCDAVYGVPIGIQGRAYAIPSKDQNIQTLPLPAIETHVETFLDFAYEISSLEFFVTKIGCGLAGYDDSDIKWMFRYAPDNCILPPDWEEMRKQFMEALTNEIFH